MHDAALKASVLYRLNGLGKTLTLQLIVPTARLISRCKVRKDAIALDAAMETNTAYKVEHLRIVNANAIHARLDSQMVLAHLAGRNSALAIG